MRIELKKPESWGANDQYVIRVDEQVVARIQEVAEVHGSKGGFGSRSMGLSYFGWTRRGGFGLSGLSSTGFGHGGAGQSFYDLGVDQSADVNTSLEVHRHGEPYLSWPQQFMAIRVSPQWGKRFRQSGLFLEARD